MSAVSSQPSWLTEPPPQRPPSPPARQARGCAVHGPHVMLRGSGHKLVLHSPRPASLRLRLQWMHPTWQALLPLDQRRNELVMQSSPLQKAAVAQNAEAGDGCRTLMRDMRTPLSTSSPLVLLPRRAWAERWVRAVHASCVCEASRVWKVPNLWGHGSLSTVALVPSPLPGPAVLRLYLL